MWNNLKTIQIVYLILFWALVLPLPLDKIQGKSQDLSGNFQIVKAPPLNKQHV